ncbi:CG5913 [Drosophila busckii]|uniref:CG5913 n=1 Tax=Drosophila busckii TaxID=30019 RepID=A0A0M5JDJ2_DROBS|nr:protein FAM98A [Drosophila busckii]ALC48794.1 CG5913 [Drosophila busckii]
MEMDLDIIDSLEALGYKGVQHEKLTQSLDDGIGSEELREVIFWLATELHLLRKTDEHVALSSKDHKDFATELSLLLTELGCPYLQFVAAPMSERFHTRESLLQLLEYLTSELMATRMSLELQSKLAEPPSKKFKTESHLQQAVEQLTSGLQLGELPKNMNSKLFLERLMPRLEQRLKQTNAAVPSEPLLKSKKPLTDGQWRELDAMQKDLDGEYNLRREMMVTRLEATVQSFQWSDGMKQRQNEIAERLKRKFQELEQLKNGDDDANIVALLAARVASSANVRKNTASIIEKHIISDVPDRGGRANEHAPPQPEMPAWQQQPAGGPAGGGRGGNFGGNFRGGFRGRGGGGGRGGHHQAQNQRPPNYQEQQQCEPDQQWLQSSGRLQGNGWNLQGGGRGGRRGGRGRGDNQRAGFR